MRRAICLHFEFAALRSARQGLEQALDCFDRAVFALDEHGIVLFANQTARQLLEAGDGLRFRGKRLHADRADQDSALQALSRGEASAGGLGGCLLLERKSGQMPFRLTFVPFASRFCGGVPGLATLLFVADPARNPLSRAGVLRALFRLSPAEIRLADLLLQGLEVKEAARRLGTAADSTRYQPKQIFAKTGTARQAELMRLMLSLPGVSLGAGELVKRRISRKS